MTVSSFCESRNGPYTNFRHAIRVYHLAFAAYDVAFTVDGDALHVVEVASA